MKYLLALLLSVGVMTAQDNPLGPMKRLVVSGNGSVTLGQVVAGYSNNFHIGIRPPRRGTLTSVQEQVEQMRNNIYPNPTTTGVVNLHTENVKSAQVCDVLGNIVYEFQNIADVNAVMTFQIFNRGIYFVKMTSNSGVNHSNILIFQ
jgi:hypothetical protein